MMMQVSQKATSSATPLVVIFIAVTTVYSRTVCYIGLYIFSAYRLINVVGLHILIIKFKEIHNLVAYK